MRDYNIYYNYTDVRSSVLIPAEYVEVYYGS